MKLNAKETRKHTYIRDIFDGTCELNDYKEISISCINDHGEVSENPIGESILQFPKDENRCYLHAISFDKEEKEHFIALARNKDNYYIDTEIINMATKFLHNLDLYDLIVKIGGTKDNKDLLESLDALDIAAEKTDKKSIDSFDKEMFFDIFLDDHLLVHGGYNSEKEISYFKIDYRSVETVMNYDARIQELDAFIVPKTKECVDDAFIIGTNLKDAGFKVVTNYTMEKFEEDSLHANFLITFDESSLKDYEVRLKDLKTKEEHTVKIDNLIEELSFQ